MSRSARVLIGIASLVLLVRSDIHADTLVMTDGRRLVGEVTQNGESYTIRMKAGTLTVPSGDVSKWEKDPAVAPTPGSPTPPSPATPTPTRAITPEDQKRALGRMQQLIHQGLMALGADDTRAALDNFIDARAVGDRARIRMDAADADIFTLYEGIAYCYMQKGRFELATDPMERAYSSPLRSRSTLANRVVLALVQHSSPMRSIKDLQAWLAAHPEPDEELLNLLGSCLFVATADNQLSRSDIYKLGTSFYENKMVQLEKTKPGQRRWGMQWLSDLDYQTKADEMAVAQKKFDAAAKARDGAYTAWQNAQADYERKQDAIKFMKAGSGARASAVSDANYLASVADGKNKTYNKKLAAANDAYKNIPWPQWQTKFPPVLPDAVLPYTRPTAVAVVQPRPTPVPSPGDIGASIRPRIVSTPTNPPANPPTSVVPPTPPPLTVASTPPTPSRRMVTRQAVAVPVGPDLLLTSAALVDAGSTIELEGAGGDEVKGEFVRKDAASDLALIRAPGQRLRYLNLADHFGGGEIQCWGYPEVSIFNVASQGFAGNAAAPKAGWTVSLQRHPRLSGAALVDKGLKLVGMVLCERDTPSSQLPAVTADAIRTFLGADAPSSACGNPDPSGVLQLTVSHAAN